MNCKDLLQTKAELLCWGLKTDESTKASLSLQNPFLFEHGYIHAAHFILDNQIINACVSEKFCQRSPYEIRQNGNSFALYKGTKFIAPISVIPLQEWSHEFVDGFMLGNFLRPHSWSCVVCWPVLKCDYYSTGQQCKFCCMGDYELEMILSESTVVKMIEIAIRHSPFYEISLGGGIHNGRDQTYAYFSRICEGIRKKFDNSISIEIAPPDNLDYLNYLHDSGATAVIINLEIANDTLRKKICPAKGKIPLQHYLDSYARAVRVFGRGNVSCVLIAGIQSKYDIMDMATKLVETGVIPTVIPFKPLDGCIMKNAQLTDPEELIEIAFYINELLKKEDLRASKQLGCTKCNGCSLETVAEMI